MIAAEASAEMNVDLDNAKLMRVPDHFIPMQYPYDKVNIYVRDCYPQYFDILWKDLFVDKMSSVLITGTPGIGKSIFYIYVLERMKQQVEIKDIVLASFNKKSDLKSCVILKQGGKPVELDEGKPIPVIDNAVYLYDGIPRIVKYGHCIKTVIFASPNHEFLKEHSKNPTMKKRFMPLWSEDEIFEAAAMLKLGLDYETIQNLISRFGGSVRYIFTENAGFRAEGLKGQDKAIRSITSFDDLRKCLDLLMEDKEIIHRIFYLVPDMEASDSYEMRLGSIYISVAIEANLKEADEQRRLKLFRWLQTHGQSRSTAGWLFENYCHGVLSSGINAVARSLTAGISNLNLTLSVGYHRTVELESIDDMFRNMYLAPDIPNLPAVDGFYVDTVGRMIYLFQMTVSLNHSIRFENLIFSISKFGLNKHGLPFALIFLVPSDIANKFPKQKITGAASFDDLKNSSVLQIRGIGGKSEKKLRSLNISSMEEFYLATQDESCLKKMTDFINKAVISNFLEIVKGINEYKELNNIPQFVWGIDVEKPQNF